MGSFNVDWTKTVENIKFLLNGKTYVGNLSDAFSLSIRAVQHKISAKNKTGLSVEELAIIARYLRCDIMDLIVFESDVFFSPCSEAVDCHFTPEDSTPEDVTNAIFNSDEEYNNFPIRNIYELLLYLPLVDEAWLRDIVYRCYGNFGPGQRDYIMHQLGFLYRTIPASPEKLYADYCRDNKLRIKGDRPGSFERVNGEVEYWAVLFNYLNKGAPANRRFCNGNQERCSASDMDARRKTGGCESTIGDRPDGERDWQTI